MKHRLEAFPLYFTRNDFYSKENKINIILNFILSKQICKKMKEICIPPNGVLCTDLLASTGLMPVMAF